MKRAIISILLAWSTLVGAQTTKLDLRIDGEGWGKGNVRDVEAVLRSAAGQLLPLFPGVELPPIRVSAKGGPIVLHRRGEDGSIIMRLNTGDTYWSQYAFQFAHELCHVLCRYDLDPTGNKWFEESICELASLYTLRSMGKAWQTDPPYPNWKGYAGSLIDYARNRIDAAALPEGQTLTRWYRENAEALGKNPTDRERNTVVAAALLPLFEQHPDRWAAVAFLNTGRPARPQAFAEFLDDWQSNAPTEHRPFIRLLAERFGITLRER